MQKNILRALALNLILGLTVQLSAGVVYKLKTSEFQDTKSSGDMTVYVDGKNLKIEFSGKASEGGNMIFLGEKNTMIMVDDRRKQYVELDEATIQQLAAQMNQAMAQYQEMLKNVPPQQRAMMEEMMKKQMGGMMRQSVPTAESVLSKGSKNKDVAGYKTTHFIEKQEGQTVREYWVADWSKVEGGDEVMEAFQGMVDFQEKLTEAFSQGGNNPFMGMVNSIKDNMFKQMKQMDGFPVSVINYRNGNPADESVLESIDKRGIDPVTFAPPKGYKKQKMDGR